MLFNSMQFLIFFPIVVGVCHMIPRRFKNLWLLFVSYYFYMCWNAKYVLLLLFSTVITYASGLLLECAKQKENSEMQSASDIKSWLWQLVLF